MANLVSLNLSVGFQKKNQQTQSDDIRECFTLFKWKDNNKRKEVRWTEMLNKFPVTEQGKSSKKPRHIHRPSQIRSEYQKATIHGALLMFWTVQFFLKGFFLVLSREVGNVFYIKREITQGKGHIFAFLILALLMFTQWLFLPQTLTVYCAPVKVNSIGYQYARQWECIHYN